MEGERDGEGQGSVSTGPPVILDGENTVIIDVTNDANANVAGLQRRGCHDRRTGGGSRRSEVGSGETDVVSRVRRA
jgi:hypothetical protein